MSCENKELQIVWKNITIQKVATKQKSSWQTEQHMIRYQSCHVWDDEQIGQNRLKKLSKKWKKVLDKTDLIRYNKQAVAENDTKNIDNWTVK